MDAYVDVASPVYDSAQEHGHENVRLEYLVLLTLACGFCMTCAIEQQLTLRCWGRSVVRCRTVDAVERDPP